MFEAKLLQSLFYPSPGRRANALLAFLAIGVIALVVWLVLVFFSVTEGLEQGWIGRLTALHGSLRVTPTAAYAESFAYQAESWAGSTHGHHRTLLEAWSSPENPWNPEEDPELPSDLEELRRVEPLTPMSGLHHALASLQALHPEIEVHPYLATPGMLLLPTRQLTFQQPVLLAAWDQLPSSVARLATAEPVSPPSHRGAWLPKAFADAGARVGDTGWITVQKLSARGVGDQRVPLVVEGFYDAGIMPVGGRILLTSSTYLQKLGYLSTPEEAPQLHGIHVSIPDAKEAASLRHELQETLRHAGVSPYWHVETYRDLDFAQELFQQFESDRLLFSIIAVIVLAVACANIISFLIILVHERRKEIGILRAMGATPAQVATIFGGAGLIIGLGGAILGTGLALLTLWQLEGVVSLLTWIQGHPAFHPAFFGGTLPNACSTRALQFVWYATPVLAIASGLIPALRACKIHPSLILKSESS